VHEGNFNDQSEDDPQCSWLVMEAVPTGLTLYTLTKLDPDDSEQDDGVHRAFHNLMPVEMICHLFVSIGGAVDFLQKHNIMHGDIREKNVMLDEATLDDLVELQYYSEFVLVDFGMAANNGDDPRRAEMECSRLCRMFRGLITEHILCSGLGAGAEPPWRMEGSICTAKEDHPPWEEFAQYMTDNTDKWRPNA
jgi:serine/threonine protein kinase